MRRTRQQKRQAGTIDLRREAIGRECQIRLPGCASEPCCLCHWRQIGISGAGMKAPDFMGAWGCASCHTIVDEADEDDYELRLDFAKAIFRTQDALFAEGKLPW